MLHLWPLDLDARKLKMGGRFVQKKWNRRQLVALCAAAGTGSAASLVFARQARADDKRAAMRAIPWPYQTLDAAAVAQRAFESFRKHHCMYGAFESIAGSVTDRLSAPFSDFPFEMFAYGAGGINGWATICGALNGAAAAFQLFSSKPEPLIDTLFNWYETAQLPDFNPKGTKFAPVGSVANSPLCHQSIANWCKASGRKSYSPERQERCGTLTASVARKAVSLLNDQAAGKLVVLAPSPATQACQSCHEKGGSLENVRTAMDCRGCHAPLIGNHPK